MKRSGHSRHALGAAALVLLATALLAPAAFAGSAVDEYSLDLPDSKGKVESPEQAPLAQPSSLPPTVVAKLAHDPHGKALATIATASALGAPQRGGLTSVDVAGDEPSTLGAVSGGVGDPAVIGLIVVLLAVGGGMFLAKRKWSA
jgi:hypothetical protein